MTVVNGQQILEGLKQTRKFFKQVSLLLRTAEDMLYEAGWREMTGSSKSSNITSDLYRPESWMPQDIYRFYVPSDESEIDKKIVLFVGVLLDREGAWKGFKEPWISSGLYEFLPDKSPPKLRYEEWVRLHLDVEQDPDGRFYAHPIGDEKWYEEIGLLYQVSMALPLVEIDDAEDLKTRVTEPLLQQVGAVPD